MVDTQIEYWAHMLDEAFCKDSTLDESASSKKKIEHTSSTTNECDAGGDAGAAGAAGDGISSDASGTSVGDVIGNCDHAHDGYLGTDCFHVPSRVKVPLHRWEIGNGGSKRKKDKKGRDKKYAYEKGMKVVVDMFEDGSSVKNKNQN